MLLINFFFRYVERVTEVLRQKMKQADTLVLKSSMMVEKRQEALEEQSKLEPRIDLLAGCTRELQKMVMNNIFQFGFAYIYIFFSFRYQKTSMKGFVNNKNYCCQLSVFVFCRLKQTFPRNTTRGLLI